MVAFKHGNPSKSRQVLESNALHVLLRVLCNLPSCREQDVKVMFLPAGPTSGHAILRILRCRLDAMVILQSHHRGLDVSTSFIACWDLAKLKLPPEKTTSREAHFITYFQMYSIIHYNTYNYILHSIKYLLIWHIIESTHHKIANQHIMIMRSHWM